MAVVQAPASGLNYVLATALAILVPGGLAKILWDGRQKKVMRARLTELEQDARTLAVEVSDLRQQLPRGSTS